MPAPQTLIDGLNKLFDDQAAAKVLDGKAVEADTAVVTAKQAASDAHTAAATADQAVTAETNAFLQAVQGELAK
jgi:hypothetical protein